MLLEADMLLPIASQICSFNETQPHAVETAAIVAFTYGSQAVEAVTIPPSSECVKLIGAVCVHTSSHAASCIQLQAPR